MSTDDLGIGPMPGPGDTPAAVVGGAVAVHLADKGDAETAASWDFIKYLVSPRCNRTWAADGLRAGRADATTIEPLASKYADDPRFSVAFEQLTAAADDVSVGPVARPDGPGARGDGADDRRDLRRLRRRPVAANGRRPGQPLIADYNSRN